MSDPRPPWAEALEDLATEYGHPEHPSAEGIAGYIEGKLPSARAEQIRDHMTRCRQCRQVVLDFENFDDLEAPSGAESIDDDQLENEWRLLEARRTLPPREATTSAPGSSLDRGNGQPKRLGQVSHEVWTQAALIAACLGLAVWGGSEWRGRRQLADGLAVRTAEVETLSKRLDEIIQSSGATLRNLQLIDLSPPSATRGLATPTRQVRLSDEAGGIVWILDIEELEATLAQAPTLQVEIVDHNDTVHWSETGLLEVETGSITFVTLDTLVAGEYRIRLVSKRGISVAEYPVTLLDNSVSTHGD